MILLFLVCQIWTCYLLALIKRNTYTNRLQCWSYALVFILPSSGQIRLLQEQHKNEIWHNAWWVTNDFLNTGSIVRLNPLFDESNNPAEFIYKWNELKKGKTVQIVVVFSLSVLSFQRSVGNFQTQICCINVILLKLVPMSLSYIAYPELSQMEKETLLMSIWWQQATKRCEVLGPNSELQTHSCLQHNIWIYSFHLNAGTTVKDEDLKIGDKIWSLFSAHIIFTWRNMNVVHHRQPLLTAFLYSQAQHRMQTFCESKIHELTYNIPQFTAWAM